jgi:hypothetical protein
MLPSVHDHTLLEYRVSLDHGSVVLRTRRPSTTESVSRDEQSLVFEGCEAHHFNHSSPGSILGHIVEHPLPAFLARVQAELDEGSRKSGWPNWWQSSVPGALNYLGTRSIRAFELTSAYGFSGWVLARSVCVLDARNAAAYARAPKPER